MKTIYRKINILKKKDNKLQREHPKSLLPSALFKLGKGKEEKKGKKQLSWQMLGKGY